MLDYATVVLGFATATFIPALIGLFLSSAAKPIRSSLVAAYGAGVYLWFFSDTLGGSSYLYVNSGFSGGLSQAGVLVLFVAAFALVFAVHDRGLRSDQKVYGSSLAIPVLVAAALSIHGLGEGVSFGTLASSGVSPRLYDSLSFVLHKALEPVMIGACYLAYSGGDTGRTRVRNLVLLSAIFALPSTIGSAIGYYVPIDVTYVFAAGAGASVYVIFSLVRPLFEFRTSETRPGLITLAFLFLLGFVSIYAAALFHST